MVTRAPSGGTLLGGCGAGHLRRQFRYDARIPAQAQITPVACTMSFMNILRSPRKLREILLIAGLAVLPAGCVYRIDIQQGNFLEAKEIDQVAVGMTRSQVRYVLGTPIVGNAFQASRWDYVYYLKNGRSRDVFQQRFTVYFEEDKVTRIEKNGTELAAPANASAKIN
jgi:outer membrane protein assembly factor BamE